MLSDYMPKLSLMGYFGMYPMSKFIEKKVFGKPAIRFGHFLLVSCYLYETGAIIGRSYSRKLSLIWDILSIELGKKQESIRFFQEEAGKRLNSFDKEPDTFIDLFWTTELATIDLVLDFSPKLRKALEEKWPVEKAEPLIKSFGIEGIAFGSKFPDLTEKMLKQAYDSDKSQIRSEMRKYGMQIDIHSSITSAEREQEALTQLKAYVSEYFPNLLKTLFEK
jgi:hypothetical protein